MPGFFFLFAVTVDCHAQFLSGHNHSRLSCLFSFCSKPQWTVMPNFFLFTITMDSHAQFLSVHNHSGLSCLISFCSQSQWTIMPDFFLFTITVDYHAWFFNTALWNHSTDMHPAINHPVRHTSPTLFCLLKKIKTIHPPPPPLPLLSKPSSNSSQTHHSSKRDRTPAGPTHAAYRSWGPSQASFPAGRRAWSWWSWSSRPSCGRWWWRRGRWSPAPGTGLPRTCWCWTAGRRRPWVSWCGWPSTACCPPRPASGLREYRGQVWRVHVGWVFMEPTPHIKAK